MSSVAVHTGCWGPRPVTWVRQAADAGLAGEVLRASRIVRPRALWGGHHRRQQHLRMHACTHERRRAVSGACRELQPRAPGLAQLRALHSPWPLPCAWCTTSAQHTQPENICRPGVYLVRADAGAVRGKGVQLGIAHICGAAQQPDILRPLRKAARVDTLPQLAQRLQAPPKHQLSSRSKHACMTRPAPAFAFLCQCMQHLHHSHGHSMTAQARPIHS